MNTIMRPFEKIFQDSCSGDPKWVAIEKERTWNEFCKAGFPTRKEEEWKYTNLSFLNKTSYEKPDANSSIDLNKIRPFLIPEAITLVYWDGLLVDVFDALNALPDGLEIMPLASALASQDQSLADALGRFSELSNRNSLILLNEAIASNGILIKVSKKATVDKPIHILHLNSHSSTHPVASFTRNTVLVEEHASAKIYESYHCLGSSNPDVRHFANKTCNILLKANAKLSYFCTQNLSKSCDQICHTRVIQHQHSQMESHALGIGGKLSRQSIEVWQTGEAAHTSLNGLFIGCEKQQCEQRTSIRHQAPFGTSDQYYKGILTGEARGVFLGHVGVAKDAQKVAAKQLNKNLLLDDRVEIDTKPELEIDSDDVKCAHGATVSQLRSDEIFYLQSRGINKEKAKYLLSYAFAFEIIAKVKDQHLVHTWDRIVKNFFEENSTQGGHA